MRNKPCFRMFHIVSAIKQAFKMKYKKKLFLFTDHHVLLEKNYASIKKPLSDSQTQAKEHIKSRNVPLCGFKCLTPTRNEPCFRMFLPHSFCTKASI